MNIDYNIPQSSIVKSHSFNRFPCSICEKKFQSQRQLHTHFERIHVSIKDIPCFQKGCDKLFTTFETARLHYGRNHLPKIYICDVGECREARSVKGDLNQHKRRAHRIDTKVHQFVCYYLNCGKSFKSNIQVMRHIAENHFEEALVPDKRMKSAYEPDSALFFPRPLFEIMPMATLSELPKQILVEHDDKVSDINESDIHLSELELEFLGEMG